MPGSQSDGQAGQKGKYGKDTLRPVTIKQLLDAHHPYPDAEHFMIDNQETTQVTFVGQVRNISQQTTNVTYKIDDGTGVVEVKVWVDSEAMNDDSGAQDGKKVNEQAYVRVYGRLKIFGNKRHVGANVIRPIQDFNEISYHLLEATVVHLQTTKGTPGDAKQQTSTNGPSNGAATSGGPNLAGLSPAARQVFTCLRNSPQTNEGLHMQDIAIQTRMEVSAVLKGGEELQGLGMIYTTFDDHTWAIMDV